MVTKNVDFKNYLTCENLVVSQSPGDGHCLLHSVIKSYQAQLNIHLDLNTIKSAIFIETVSKVDHYVHFILPGEKLLICLRKYIINKNYNNSLGDLLPLIIANALSVNIKILDQNNKLAEIIDIYPTSGLTLTTITLHRHGDHYNGLTHNYLPSTCTGPPSSTLTSGVCREIHRQLARPVVTSPNSGPIKYTSKDLLALRPSSSKILEK